MNEYRVIGKRVPRVDGVAKATGKAEYTADIVLPEMLHGKVLRSPYPHARILSIDTSKAKAVPGVKAVITAKDIPEVKPGMLAGDAGDQSPLAVDRVRYIGEEIAALAAVDEDTAEEALDLIKVDYEELPAVYDAEEAMKEGAPQVHDHIQNNISGSCSYHFGDVEAGFRQSDLIREDRFTTQFVMHGYLEPPSVVASWDSSGKLTIWASKQSYFILSHFISGRFNLTPDNIRIIQPFVGGSFGGKVQTLGIDWAAVLLSKIAGKPVKIICTNDETLTSSKNNTPVVVYLKTGVKKDGTLVATQVRVINDGGAYSGGGQIVLGLYGFLINLPYKFPNVKYDGYRIFTNKPASSGMRGFGIPQIRFACDSQIDLLSKDLGLDPMEMRLRNAVQAGDVTANKMKVKSCGLSECIEKAAEAINWKERREKKEDGKTRRGLGIASYAFQSGKWYGGPSPFNASVEVQRDGSVRLVSGTHDVGQGSDTTHCQIVAEILGLNLGDVSVAQVDSDLIPLDMGAFATISDAAKAVRIAAEDAREKLAEVASGLLGVKAKDVEFRDRRVYVKGNAEKGMPFPSLAQLACESKGETIFGRGSFVEEVKNAPNYETCEGDLSPDYSFGAQAAEVEVDAETGAVKVKKIVAFHDCGLALNPIVVEGQLDGSMCGGIGQVLLEQRIFTDKGQTLNPSFLEYKMPTSLDIAEETESHLVESIGPTETLQAKEAAEGLMAGILAAIGNAIFDATGVMVKDLPITPDKVLKVLEEKKEEPTT